MTVSKEEIQHLKAERELKVVGNSVVIAGVEVVVRGINADGERFFK